MKHIARKGGPVRVRCLGLLVTAALAIAACGGTDAEPRSVAWSWDPCGLAPLPEVSAAFEAEAAAVASPADDECRYDVDGTLLRVIVLSDSDTCEGTRRSMTALGSTVSAPADAPSGVFVIEPEGDVMVCDPQVTYLLRAEGRSTELLALAQTMPSDRSD